MTAVGSLCVSSLMNSKVPTEDLLLSTMCRLGNVEVPTNLHHM